MPQTITGWSEEARFWLPGDTRQAYGRLDFAPLRGPGVHVVDSPLGHRDRREVVDVLYGETLGGSPLTLFDGQIVGSMRYGGSFGNTADVVFTTLVRGKRLERLNAVRAAAASVAIHGLREFLRGGKVDTQLLDVTSDRDSHAQCEVALPLGALRMTAHAAENWNRDESTTVVHAQANFEFHRPHSLIEVDAAVAPLRDLVVFSTRQPSFVTGLRLDQQADVTLGEDDYVRPLDIFRRQELERWPDHSGAYYALLLNPATVPGGIDIVADWYRLRERLGPAWPLFFSTIVNRDLPPESQLLNLTSFAEGYHRTLHDKPPLTQGEATAARDVMLAALPDDRHRDVYRMSLLHAHEQSQRGRVRRLVKNALTVVTAWELDVEPFCGQVSDTRNWLTHLGDRGSEVQEGEALTVLLRRLYIVMVANILLDLGLDHQAAAAQMASGLRLESLP